MKYPHNPTFISIFHFPFFLSFNPNFSVFHFSSSSPLLSEEQLRCCCGCSLSRSFVRKKKEREKMNHCGYQQRNAMTGCEEMKVESVVCPKPRRLGLLSIDNHIRTLRPPFNNYQTDIEDSGVGAELLDIIRPKGSCYNPDRYGGQVATSPPYFCGSPPSRASNPVIQDEQFGNGSVNVNFSPFSMAPPSPSSSARSCVRMKFSHTPAAVRVEGFDCLNMDRSNRSIYARA